MSKLLVTGGAGLNQQVAFCDAEWRSSDIKPEKLFEVQETKGAI